MKKIALLLCGILIASATAFAHPPSDIKIQFDVKTQTLNAVIMHRVSNPLTHYIYKVDIGLNGKEVKSLSFKQQATNREQLATAVLSGVKKGDSLSVEGYCNLSGKLEKEINVA